MEVLLEGQGWSRERGRAHARDLAEMLARMEERGLAHCDLSGPNVLLPAMAEGSPNTPPNRSVQLPIELVDVEQMYAPGLDRPATLPAGSPGYAHRTATAGLWEPAADRFAGAVLIAEMLGWADGRVRADAWGESYFEPGELQQDGDRLRTLVEALRTEAGEGVSDLFLRAWTSETLADCPTFGDWLLALPDSAISQYNQPIASTQAPGSVPTRAPEPYFTPQASVPPSRTDTPDLPVLFDAGLAALRAGDLDRAHELLTAVARQQPDYSRGGQSVSDLISSATTRRKRTGQTTTRRIILLTLPAIVLLLVAFVGLWQFIISTPHPPPDQGSSSTPAPASIGPAVQGTVLSLLNVDRIEALKRIGKGPAGPLAWSSDGHVLAVGSSYGTYFYDPVTLTDIRFISQDAIVQALAFSPTDDMLASAGADGKLRLWQSNTGQLIKTLEGHLGPVLSVAFSPDGSMLVSGGMDTSVRIWRVSSGEQVLKLDGKHTVISVTFSPESTRLAAASDHGEILLWQAGNGTLLRELKGSPGTNVAFSPDGMLLAAGSGDYNQPAVSIWQVSNGEVAHTLQGHSGSIESVAFSPGGTMLAAGGLDSTVYFWKVIDGSPYGTPLRRSGPVMDIAYSPDGAMLAASGNGDTVWLTSGGGLGQDRELTGHTERTRAFSYDSQGTLFASGNGNGNISLWQGSDGSPLRTLRGHTGWIDDLAFNPDGTLLASGSADNTVRLWRVAEGSLVRALGSANRSFRSVAFSPDGQTVVGSDEGGTVYLWQVSDGTPVHQLVGYDATFSPDGKLLAMRSEDTLVQLWSVPDWLLLRTLQSPKRINSITFSPDGTLLAGGGDSIVQLWQVSDGNSVASPQEDVGSVLGIAFSPDGTLLATGSGDGAVRLWSAVDARLVRKLIGHTRTVWQVAFRPDGAQLASISEDGSMILWGLR